MKKILFVLPVILLIAAACNSVPKQTQPISESNIQNKQTENKKIDLGDINFQNGQLNRDLVVNGTKLKVIQSGLELYFQDHNSYPASLDQLMPSYVKDASLAGSSIFEDYVTKKQFTYQATADNFEICGKIETGDLICAHKIIPYDSGIRGNAILSPTCSVQKAAESCSKPYANAKLRIKSNDGKMEAVTSTDSNGNFKVELKPGAYTITSQNSGFPTLKPQNVEVLNKQYIKVTLNFDTGMR